MDDPVNPTTVSTFKFGRHPGHVLQFSGGPLPNPFRFPVSPDSSGQDGLMTLVDRVVAHRLTYQVRGDGEDLQAVLGQQSLPAKGR